MNEVIKDLERVAAYLDDVIVFGPTRLPTSITSEPYSNAYASTT